MEELRTISKEQILMAFVATCIETTARFLNADYKEIFQRMERVGMIDNYIIPNYDPLHSESREVLAQRLVECLDNWEKEIIVYHGGTEFVDKPDCKRGRKNLDFGQGFYVTDICDQAVKWAFSIKI